MVPKLIVERLEHGVLAKMAGAQSSDGTQLDDDTWCWVTGQLDFDYEQSFLVEIRTSARDAWGEKITTSDFMGVCWGYTSGGAWFIQHSFWNQPKQFPEVNDPYEAMRWWVSWTEQVRTAAHS